MENQKTPSQDTESINPQITAKEAILEAKAEALNIIKKAEDDAGKIRQSVLELEKRLEQREEQLAAKLSRIEAKEEGLRKSEDSLLKRTEEVDNFRKELIESLKKVTTFTAEEAKKEILTRVEEEIKPEKSRIVKTAIEKAKNEADIRAKDILITSIQRISTDYVAEYTTSIVKLPDESFKGRIIGFKGRNIQALERASGVTVDLDEAPDAVRLSCFDGVKREIAKMALERLIADGRIQPERIEAEISKAKENLEKDLKNIGEKVAYEAGVHGLPDELLSLVGRFKFRTSYGQNLITHSLEVVNIAKMLALEFGADVEIAKMAALLHDIGKVKTSEVEGSHARITRQIMEQYKLDPKAINAAAAHHEEEPFESVEAFIVQIADAVSGARPGARFEDYEEYLKRMKSLEEAALSFSEVKEAYAISAGRQLRVVIRPEGVDDAAVVDTARRIAQKIEKEQVYPGQIEVTAIKEIRATETAR